MKKKTKKIWRMGKRRRYILAAVLALLVVLGILVGVLVIDPAKKEAR